MEHGTPVTTDTTTTETTETEQETVDWEKRFKDTQASFTKSRTEISKLKAENQLLNSLVTPKLELDDATKDRLEDLKTSNPEAWRTEVNRLEEEAAAKHSQTISSVATEASKQAELESRSALLAEFNKKSKFPITDEVIAFDIPPRITAKLAEGTITFEEFLQEAHSYLESPKVVGTGTTVTGQPNLGEAAGSESSADYTAEPDSVTSYRTEIY